MSVFVAVFPGQALADDSATVGEVQRLSARGDFEAAKRSAQSLLGSGKCSREEAARVHFELGVIAAAQDERAEAELCFRRALRLDPTLRLNESAGPHVVATLEHAEQTLAETPALQVAATLTPSSELGEILLTVDVRGESDGLVRAIVLEEDGVAPVRHDLDESTPSFAAKVPVSSEKCTELRASVVDGGGNRLWPDLASLVRCPMDGRAGPANVAANPDVGRLTPVTNVRPSSRPRGARPVPSYVWITAAATGGLLVVATTSGFVALERRDYYHEAVHDPDVPLAEKAHRRERASNAELTATVFGALTAAGAAATAVLYFTRPGSRVDVGLQVSPLFDRAIATASARF